jgi:hypothetical protein
MLVVEGFSSSISDSTISLTCAMPESSAFEVAWQSLLMWATLPLLLLVCFTIVYGLASIVFCPRVCGNGGIQARHSRRGLSEDSISSSARENKIRSTSGSSLICFCFPKAWKVAWTSRLGKLQSPQDNCIMACVYGLYLMYPTLTTASFSLLRCVPVPDGENGKPILYLIADQQVQCYTGIHLEWVVLLTIPCFALFVVGLPLMGVLILRLNRKALYDRTHSNHRWTMVKYGLLFDGYKKDAWWFELVVALRKAGFVALAIMTEGQIQVQLAIGFLALMVAMNVMIEPYGIGMGAETNDNRLPNRDASSSRSRSDFGSNSSSRGAASHRKIDRQNSYVQNKYDHTVLHRMDLVALLTSLVLAWSGMLFILAKDKRQGAAEHTIEEEILGLVVLALNIGLLLWAMYAFFTRWVHEHERHFKSVARLAKKVRERASVSRRGSARKVKATKEVFKRSTLNPLSTGSGAQLNPLSTGAGALLPQMSAKIEMAGAKLSAKAGAKIRGGGHSREKSLGKLKEMTVITLTAAVEPAGREKIKLKGRQLLSKHNRDYIGVAVGHDAQDTGFLSGEAEIFVKVDDYSTNPMLIVTRRRGNGTCLIRPRRNANGLLTMKIRTRFLRIPIS